MLGYNGKKSVKNSYDRTSGRQSHQKMEDNGIIKAYSIVVDELKMGFSFTAFVFFFMNAYMHDDLLKFIATRNEISEAHRVSGDACYLLKVTVHSQEVLNHLLNDLLKYGNYQLYLSIKEVKSIIILH